MIVDVHTHTPTHVEPVPEGERRSYDTWRNDRPVVTTNSWADHAATQAEAGVDVSIVFNIMVDEPERMTGLPYATLTANDATAAFVADDPSTRIGFMGLDPTKANVLDEADRARDLGLVGIKLGPNYSGFDPLSPEARKVYDYAERHGLPILFHQGTSPIRDAPIRYAFPLLMDEIAIAHPELRVVMAHMGHPWPRETAVVIRKHPHVYADVSSLILRPRLCWEALIEAVEWGAAHKLLFGSDYPVVFASETMVGLRKVNEVVEGTNLPRVPDEVVESIINADALSALGLERPA